MPPRSRPLGPVACGSPSTPGSGAAPRRSAAPSRWIRNGSRTDRATIDDPALCAELTARGVPLDLCPSSNWQAGIVPSVAAHPLARLHRLGVPVTLNTDDTTVSDITLSEEYANAVEAIGLTLPELWAIDRSALDVAFADEATLTPDPRRIRCLGGGIPELQARPARSAALDGPQVRAQRYPRIAAQPRPVRRSDMSQRKAERNAGAFLSPTDGSMIPVPMRTLSDEYHDEPTDPPDDRVPEPEPPSSSSGCSTGWGGPPGSLTAARRRVRTTRPRARPPARRHPRRSRSVGRRPRARRSGLAS